MSRSVFIFLEARVFVNAPGRNPSVFSPLNTKRLDFICGVVYRRCRPRFCAFFYMQCTGTMSPRNGEEAAKACSSS
jgi:hypothetical protein